MPKRTFRLKTWKSLEEVSKPININGEVNYFIPMKYHGLKETNPITSAEEEIKEDLKYFDEHKWDTKETILLIGTNY